MKILTSLFSFLSTITKDLQIKLFFFKSFFSNALFSLFFGFLVGNLFGTSLNTIRSFISWDGFIISLILFSMEFLNSVLYKSFLKEKEKLTQLYPSPSLLLFLNWKSINILKIGVNLGFFIDAFKVGS